MSTSRESSRQDVLARRPGRNGRTKPNIEELEDAYRALETYKKEEERHKKEAEKEQKAQLAADKKLMNRALQQAQKQVNSTQKAVNGLLRQLDKVEVDINKKSGLKALQEAKREELLKKLREDQHHAEVQLNAKRAEVGESKGRLECIERALGQLGGEDISMGADLSMGTAISEDPQIEAEVEEQDHLRKLADDIRVRNDVLADENQQLRHDLEDALRTAEGRRAAKEQAVADRRHTRQEQRLQAREARERRRNESQRRKLEDLASTLDKTSCGNPHAGTDGAFGASPPSSTFPALGQPSPLIGASALLQQSRASRPMSVRSSNGIASAPQAHHIAPVQQISTTMLLSRSMTPRRLASPMDGAHMHVAPCPVTPGCPRGRSPRGMLHPSSPHQVASPAGPLPMWATGFAGHQAQALSARSPSGSPLLGGLSCASARAVPKVYTAPGPRPADGGYGAPVFRTPSGPLPPQLSGSLSSPAPPLGGVRYAAEPIGTPPMAQLAPWPGAYSAAALPAGGGLSAMAGLARPMSYPVLAGPMPRMQASSPTPTRPAPAPQMEPVAQRPGAGRKRGSITDVLFDAIDVDHNGSITREELRMALREEIVTAI